MFKDIKIGELFTNERLLKNNQHIPSLWRKKSTRTATLAHNPSIWFYFSANDAAYKKSETQANV